MYILIVEDDPLQAELMIEAINADALLGKSRVERISTEFLFRQKFEEIVRDRPDVITIDIMLRWADASPMVTVETTPKEVVEKGIFEAGLRCERLLSKEPQTKHIPIIFYTIVSEEDLGEGLPQRANLLHIPKDSDLSPLIRAIRDVLRR